MPRPRLEAVPMTVRIPRAQKFEVEAAAEEDGIPVSVLIRLALTDWLRARRATQRKEARV